MTLHFRSIAQLSQSVAAGLPRIPRSVDLVVGIPRSGMLVASMIALARNLPLADLDQFLDGRVMRSGTTRSQRQAAAAEARHVLLVDDSCRTGAAMTAARRRVDSTSEGMRYTTCVVYGVPGANPGVDLLLETVPEPRVFEWNVLHHPTIDRACVDIDGVLCVDPTDAENDDGSAYRRFLAGARPLHIPSRVIGTLVTSRLEKYRPQTEAWLERHGIRYRSLRMLDCPDASTRRALGLHGSFKASVYAALDSPLFIESELHQAREIARISGKPVLSLDGMVLCRPHQLSLAAIRQEAKPGNLMKMVGKALLGARGLRAIRSVRARSAVCD